MRQSIVKCVIAGCAAVLPSAAFAHTGTGDAGGFVHGFAHPVGGLDHVLAMVLVGLLAWQLGGRALWLVPASFVAVMAAGGVLGVAGVEVPFVEAGIALSSVVFGAAIALGIRTPAAAVAVLVGLFAVFHGHAHGAEMPADSSGLAYGLGFVLATALLHAGGIGTGFALGMVGAQGGALLVRASGGAAALAGLAILAGVL